MLINATQSEEIRVALVNGQTLYDLDLENMDKELLKGNLYLATVKNIEQSLNAAFVDYGAERHGFLPLKEISKDYFQSAEDMNSDEGRGPRKNIRDILRVGQQVLVQVDKDERGTKGAALTTFITLAGCYLVLMPNNPRAGGISRRIEGEEREELRDTLEGLKVPEGMGVIVRTAGVGRDPSELKWDLEVLLKRWEDILNAVANVNAPALIHQERDIIARAIRDHLRDDVEEILIDSPVYFEKARHYVERLRPELLTRLKLYTDIVPLFSRFQIENQIESAFQRQVTLPSGGTLVIDHTEALISIDINSARATRGHDIEETAFHTNLEAAEEIARQLRLRDLGGLIVIDFIDMMATSHQREVENRLRDAMRLDRARVQIGRISRFGLLEMSRQRLRSSLSESVQEPCPRCSGQGSIRSIESLSLSIIRLIEEEAMKDGTVAVYAALPIDVATFLTNEKRNMLSALEARHGRKVVVMPVVEIQAPNYQIRRIRENESATMSDASSFEMAREMGTRSIEQSAHVQPLRQAPQTPVVQFLSDVKPREQSLIQKSVNGISQLFKSVFKAEKEDEAPTTTRPVAASTGERQERREGGDRSERSGGRGRYGRRRDNRRDNRAPRPEGEFEARDNRRDNRAPRPEGESEARDNRRDNRAPRPEGEFEARDNRRDNRPPRQDVRQEPRQEVREEETSTQQGNRRGIGQDRRRHDGRRAPDAQPRFDDMPAPLAMNDEHDDLHDIDALDIQPPDIDHRSPMERQATAGAPRHEHSRGRGHGGHRRKRPDQDRQPRVDAFPQDEQVAPRFVKHETPMPSPIVDMMDEPEIVVHHEAPVVDVAPAPVVKPAPRVPRERKVPKINSPLMQETTLMDVTAMNAAAAAQAAADTQGEMSSDAPAYDEAGNAGETVERTQERKFSRRRANHLRPYHRNKGENATTDNK